MPRLFMLGVLSLSLVAAFAPAGALAQDDSPAALRRTIDQQAERIAELEALLERANAKIADLTEVNRTLRETIRKNVNDAKTPAPAQPDAAPDTPAELPADPFASPESMRAALAQAWQAEFAGVDLNDEAQRRRYLRDVRRWAGKAQRENRGPIDWRVHVVSARDEGRQTTSAQVQILTDDNRPVGEPVGVTVTGRAARTVLSAPADAVLELTGTISVILTVDARLRATEGQTGDYIDTVIETTITSARYE